MSGKITECMEISGTYIVLIIGIIVVFIYCMIEVDYNDKIKRIIDNQFNENFIVHTVCDKCKSMNRKRCGECNDCGYYHSAVDRSHRSLCKERLYRL